MGTAVAAHTQAETKHYMMHFPAHPAREDDPHYKDFDAFHRRHRPTARCAIGVRYGDFGECKDAQGKPVVIDDKGEMSGIELHHSHVEFSLENGIDLKLLEKDYPGISNRTEEGEWVESGKNFIWYCAFHHRGHGGAHTASASDFEAERYVRDLIS